MSPHDRRIRPGCASAKPTALVSGCGGPALTAQGPIVSRAGLRKSAKRFSARNPL